MSTFRTTRFIKTSTAVLGVATVVALFPIASTMANSTQAKQTKNPPAQQPAKSDSLFPPTKLGAHQFTIKSAKFSSRFFTSDENHVAEAGKKFLILDLTVQNPGTTDLTYSWATLDFTVVGADTDNFPYLPVAINPEKLTPLDLDLKPKQTIPVQIAIKVPANDPIHKLMVKAGSDGQPIRFDLRNKMAKYSEAFADPNGITIKDSSDFALGQSFPNDALNVVIDKVEGVQSPIGDYDASEGEQFFVVFATITNPSLTEEQLDWGIFEASMFDQNGEPIESSSAMLRAVGNDSVNTKLKAGQSIKVRMLFHGNKSLTPTKLSLKARASERIANLKLTK